MEIVDKCILCGSKTSRVIGEYVTGEFAHMCECDLIYLSPRISNTESYSDGTFAKAVGRNTGPWKDSIVKKAKIRHDMVRHECGDFVSILDVGCSEGVFLDLFEDKDVAGIDPSTSRKEYIRGDFPEDMPSGKFDVITMFHSIEHVPDPVGFISSTHEYLNDDGYLLVEYPDIGRKLMRDNVELCNMFDNRFHLFEFSGATIERLLKRCGYEVEGRFCFSDEKNNTEYKNLALLAKSL